MSWNDVLAATALEQAGMIRARAISSEELARVYLDRIERRGCPESCRN
jgi:Asp-tRNA(Asn)/Glu-tRNA(Gln) amidotransferase A subunit family amidase